MAVIIPSWTEGQNFIGAIESGARLGLSRQQMLQQAEEHAADLANQRDEFAMRQSQSDAERAQAAEQFNANLNQRQQENAAEALLRQQQLKQNGLLGTARFENEGLRLQNQSDALSAREALDNAKAAAMNKKATFVNTGNGLFTQDPDTGKWSQVPNSSKPQFKEVPTYIPPVEGKDADVTSHWFSPDVTNSPAVLPVPGHWYNKKVPVDDSSAASALSSPTASVLQTPKPRAPSGFIGNPGGENNFDPSATGFTMGVPSAAPQASDSPRAAAQGYKIGATYKGGLTYLGGDINDQNSWKSATDSTETGQ